MLAGPELRGREAGTSDARRAAWLIARYFESIGARPDDSGGFCRPFASGWLEDQNVIAHLEPIGGDACGWVLLGAHYDALGMDARGRILPGADDNASGVAVLLETARLLAAERPAVGVVLAAFGAEEQDIAGARAYAERPSIEGERPLLMINVDMAGRRPAGTSAIGFETFGPDRPRTTRLVRGASARSGFAAVPARLGDRGDHAAFSARIPAVFFSTMVHSDYHAPTDTPERIDAAQVTGTLRLVLELIRAVRCPETAPP